MRGMELNRPGRFATVSSQVSCRKHHIVLLHYAKVCRMETFSKAEFWMVIRNMEERPVYNITISYEYSRQLELLREITWEKGYGSLGKSKRIRFPVLLGRGTRENQIVLYVAGQVRRKAGQPLSMICARYKAAYRDWEGQWIHTPTNSLKIKG